MGTAAIVRSLRQHGRELRAQLASQLFDEGGLKVLFQHASNVLAGTLVLSSGLHVSAHAGYAVAGLGAVLLALNLWDGMRRLARRHYSLTLRVLAGTAHVALSLRLIEAVTLFRGGF
jgi:hypothetical protein